MDKSLLLLGTTRPRWTAAGINFLTQDEIAIFLIAYRHGLRASEVGKLVSADLDLGF